MAGPGTSAVVSPAQPQTTVEPPGGPFVRHSEPGKRRIFDLTGNAFGALVNQPLKAIPGYTRAFRFEFIGSGGANGNSSNVQLAADAPENLVSLITVRDALGTPVVSGPGFEMLRLVPWFSGGFGLGAMADPHNLPSFSATLVGTQSTATGNFTFSSCIPFEFGKAYGVIGQADASELPDLSIQLAGSGTFYTTAPPTVPTVEIKMGADFYWLPQGEDVEPPGLGSTRQWFLKQGNPAMASNTTETITLPRQGGWLDTLLLIGRDSGGARTDSWIPSIIRLYIDGIGIVDCTKDEFLDDMAIVWGWGGSYTRPTGVIAWCRKTSLNQINLGLLDTYEVAQSTSPGTTIECEGAPYGTFSNSPGTLNVVEGLVIPSGPMIQGLQEV